jgi:tetratricopeptide (TPR) repeat protein
MMKKIFPFILCLLVASVGSTQDTAAFKKHYQKVYRQALAYNDANAAINALQNYIAVDNNNRYKDTLSMLYFNVKSYYSALLLAEEVYKADAENVTAMARAAECYDELGDPKTAIELYEKVVPKTKNPYQIYKLGICQYQLKRTVESEASARAALADTSSKRIGVVFTMADGNQQTVPVDAAAANLLGVLKMDAKNFAGAKLDFQQSLKLFPDFAGAKGNLDVCDRNLKPGAKTPSKPPTKPKGQ